MVAAMHPEFSGPSGQLVECSYMDPRIDLKAARQLLNRSDLDGNEFGTALSNLIELVKFHKADELLSSSSEILLHGSKHVTTNEQPGISESSSQVSNELSITDPTKDPDLEELDEALRISQEKGLVMKFTDPGLTWKTMRNSVIVTNLPSSGERIMKEAEQNLRDAFRIPQTVKCYMRKPRGLKLFALHATLVFDTPAEAIAMESQIDQKFFQGRVLGCRYLGYGTKNFEAHDSAKETADSMDSDAADEVTSDNHQPASENPVADDIEIVLGTAKSTSALTRLTNHLNTFVRPRQTKEEHVPPLEVSSEHVAEDERSVEVVETGNMREDEKVVPGNTDDAEKLAEGQRTKQGGQQMQDKPVENDAEDQQDIAGIRSLNPEDLNPDPSRADEGVASELMEDVG
ncbi:uncharacterized protein LY89DRAFT_87034 [Mollisia scopiformis]|uniref:Uncharacterized protein n=1 Tax=Mollisia scopiformis TaxID=149040 RepID=A0A194X8Q5_MOLSC|nr:uncharacterized protein LY89DRAFT_87034 [Mollisia scopiformis]KUJ16556.1 hypothetical protein LY89DRAFT_87034 [Mollisia scopiformis]